MEDQWCQGKPYLVSILALGRPRGFLPVNGRLLGFPSLEGIPSACSCPLSPSHPSQIRQDKVGHLGASLQRWIPRPCRAGPSATHYPIQCTLVTWTQTGSLHFLADSWLPLALLRHSILALVIDGENLLRVLVYFFPQVDTVFSCESCNSSTLFPRFE